MNTNPIDATTGTADGNGIDIANVWNSLKEQIQVFIAAKPEGGNGDAIGYVGYGIGYIKTMRDLRYVIRRSDDSVIIQEVRSEITDLIAKLIRHLSHIPLDSTNERVQRYAQILGHYRSEELADDKTLVDDFDKIKQAYFDNPEDGNACNQFGWMLHDCLKVASRRLFNVKLTRFFLNEFEHWKYAGDENCRDPRLEDVRSADIARAKAFLEGPCEAVAYQYKREWKNAVFASESFLKRNPKNVLAFEIAIDACRHLNDFVKMTTFCLDAMSQIPAEKSFQENFIKALRNLFWTVYGYAEERYEERLDNLCLLLSMLNEGMDFLDAIDPKTKPYVEMVDVATRSITSIFYTYRCILNQIYRNKQHGEDAVEMELSGSLPDSPPSKSVHADSQEDSFERILNEKVSESISQYLSFVRKWNLENLPDDARKFCEGTDRRRLPLAGRIVLALLRCVAWTAEKKVLEENPWLMSFAKQENLLFRSNPSDYCFRMADAYYKLGDMEASRTYALDLVRDNQAEGWRWRVLGRTYPINSQEKADCLSHACSRESRVSEIYDFELMLNYAFYDTDGAEEDVMQDVDKAAIREDVRRSDQRAETLLLEGARNYDGVIISRIIDRRKHDDKGCPIEGSQSLRIWWRDETGNERTDFVSFTHLDKLNQSEPGTPVSVAVANMIGRERVIGISLRQSGKPFDIYPYHTGVVVMLNESRHVLKVMYAAGQTCSINMKRLGSGMAFHVGDMCSVALLERTDMSPLVLDVKSPETGMPRPAFVRDFGGVLARERGKRDAHVGEITVPAGVYERFAIGKTVKGTAVVSHVRDDGSSIWTAVCCQLISGDLGV